ncbi:iron-containing alcohol dehydrogenase [Delftia tsuruhatensis]
MAFINYVTQIQFDFGAVRLLRQECERVGITRPLIVTDQGVKAAGAAKGAGWAGRHAARSVRPDALQPHRGCRAAAAIYQEQRCDGLIAVGGGSAIDCAKGVAIAATHEGPLSHYATIEAARRASPSAWHR